ncbi:MAG TPA: hypothetical protein VHP58_02880 [Alphaproteobacteria bacterium]|nr:hypothetical protein [Alphaproteobacteria bacterium]
MAFTDPVQAQSSGYYGGSNAYQFGGQPGFFGGNQSAGRVNVFNVSAAAGNSTNFLGCGGIGIFNFSKLTFNANNVIDQLKSSMQTMLAKQLLTTAMSIPQVSAIFDTLNAFGNARFDLFNQSCNLNQIKKDARDAVIKKCVADGGDQTTCQNNWDSQANAGKWLKDAMKNLCGFQNFNQSTRAPMCKDDSGNAVSNCALMAFMPQYSLSFSGGASGSGGGGMCAGGSSNTGVRQPVFVLQSSVDAIRGVSNVYGTKAINSIQQARASGVTRAEMELAYQAAVKKCNEDRANCGKGGGGSAAIAQPGFVQLAKVDLTQLGFAADSTSTPDAMEGRFKKYIGCADNADPMALMKELNTQLQIIRPGASLGDLSLAEKDAQDITKSLNFNITGDATASQQLGIDAKSAARLLQVGTTCIMAGGLSGLEPAKIIDLVYNQDSDCADAYINGSGVRVGHVVANYLYPFLKTEVKNMKTAILSGQIKSVDKNNGTIVDQADAEPSEAVKAAYIAAADSADNFFSDSLKSEATHYGGIKDQVERVLKPGACQAPQPQPVILQQDPEV